MQRPDGKLITFAFKSASDRLEGITSPRGITTSFSYHPINGMISEIEEPTGQKLSFDYEGALPTRTTWTGEVNGSVGREYDENFRVTSLDVNGEDPGTKVELTCHGDGDVDEEKSYEFAEKLNRAPRGKTTPGQSIERHRPWDSKMTGKIIGDRF